MISEPRYQELRSSIEQGKLQQALKLLNGTSPHRYTGVFAFDPPELRNLALADAWDPEAKPLESAPLEETFCGLVRATGQAVVTNDARSDPRLRGHVLANNAVKSYCGVLLFDRGGQPRGTLCHFDTQPCDIGVQGVSLLESAAALIAEKNLLWENHEAG